METSEVRMTVNNIISEDLKILVFGTDIDSPKSAASLQSALMLMNGIYSVDIDLEYSENVLRVECHPETSPKLIVELLAELGFNSAELSYEILEGSRSIILE